MENGKLCANYFRIKGIDPNSEEAKDIQEQTMAINSSYAKMKKENRSDLSAPKCFDDLDIQNAYDRAVARVWHAKNKRLKEEGLEPIYK